MKRFLSIDWDYFVNASFLERCMMFPDGGNENLPETIRNFIWDSRYQNPELEKIGVIPDYKFLLQTCKNFKGKALVADSHKWMYDFVMKNTSPNEEFEVYNIDFHHDLYNFKTSGGEVNCGNWATLLKRDRPKMNYVWIRSETSDTYAGDKEVDVSTVPLGMLKMLFNLGLYDSFGYLFMCRSAVWSPPHLDPKFIKAFKSIKCNLEYEQGIDIPRPYEIPSYCGFELQTNNDSDQAI